MSPAVTDAARDVERLLHQYAEAVDGGDFERVGALFRHGRVQADDGTLLAEGQAGVATFYRATVRIHDDGTPRTRHLTTNVVVEVDLEGGTATSRSSYTVLQASGSLPLQVVAVGRYRDTFRRTEGQWWFEVRTMALDLAGDLSQHLLG